MGCSRRFDIDHFSYLSAIFSRECVFKADLVRAERVNMLDSSCDPDSMDGGWQGGNGGSVVQKLCMCAVFSRVQYIQGRTHAYLQANMHRLLSHLHPRYCSFFLALQPTGTTATHHTQLILRTCMHTYRSPYSTAWYVYTTED